MAMNLYLVKTGKDWFSAYQQKFDNMEQMSVFQVLAMEKLPLECCAKSLSDVFGGLHINKLFFVSLALEL